MVRFLKDFPLRGRPVRDSPATGPAIHRLLDPPHGRICRGSGLHKRPAHPTSGSGTHRPVAAFASCARTTARSLCPVCSTPRTTLDDLPP